MSSPPGWPATLVAGRVGLRPMRRRDAVDWVDLRLRNAQWLAPWEGYPPSEPPRPWRERQTVQIYLSMLRVARRDAAAGRSLPFALLYDGQLAGQVVIGAIVRAASCTGTVGYWVDQAVAGRGVAPTAVALAVDHCFGPAGLHRVEAAVRPENTRSLRVVEKLGFRREGIAERSLHIDGKWCDHIVHALTQEDVPEGLLRRWRASGGGVGGPARGGR